MTEKELEQAQRLVDKLPVGQRLCLSEIYGEFWSSVAHPKQFGKTFKKAVFEKRLKGITYIGIRTTGRCDEYERV